LGRGGGGGGETAAASEAGSEEDLIDFEDEADEAFFDVGLTEEDEALGLAGFAAAAVDVLLDAAVALGTDLTGFAAAVTEIGLTALGFEEELVIVLLDAFALMETLLVPLKLEFSEKEMKMAKMATKKMEIEENNSCKSNQTRAREDDDRF
jgi:hypothetical protein